MSLHLVPAHLHQPNAGSLDILFNGLFLDQFGSPGLGFAEHLQVKYGRQAIEVRFPARGLLLLDAHDRFLVDGVGQLFASALHQCQTLVLLVGRTAVLYLSPQLTLALLAIAVAFPLAVGPSGHSPQIPFLAVIGGQVVIDRAGVGRRVSLPFAAQVSAGVAVRDTALAVVRLFGVRTHVKPSLAVRLGLHFGSLRSAAEEGSAATCADVNGG